MKHPLLRALRSVGLEPVDVAAELAVDPKTVQRWLGGRIPYPRHRAALVRITGWTARELWPDAVAVHEREPSQSEVLITYPHRSAVPSDAWSRLFERAKHEIGVLAYSALFLAEDAAVHQLLREKARAGVRVRITLGDLDGAQVARRGADESIDEIMLARVRNAIILYGPLADVPGIELRLHDTILYNSIYRADDDLLINLHIYGRPASLAPVLQLRRNRVDGMAATYIDSFERVWAAARTLDDVERRRHRAEG